MTEGPRHKQPEIDPLARACVGLGLFTEDRARSEAACRCSVDSAGRRYVHPACFHAIPAEARAPAAETKRRELDAVIAERARLVAAGTASSSELDALDDIERHLRARLAGGSS